MEVPLGQSPGSAIWRCMPQRSLTRCASRQTSQKPDLYHSQNAVLSSPLSKLSCKQTHLVCAGEP